MLAEINGGLAQIDSSNSRKDLELGLLHTKVVILINLVREVTGKFDCPDSFLQSLSDVVGWRVERTQESLEKAETVVFNMLPKSQRLDIYASYHNPKTSES